MIPLRSLIKSAPAVSRMALQKRTSVISSPPKNRIPFAEKIGLGLVMIGGICFIPAWVLVHIQDYQKKD